MRALRSRPACSVTVCTVLALERTLIGSLFIFSISEMIESHAEFLAGRQSLSVCRKGGMCLCRRVAVHTGRQVAQAA